MKILFWLSMALIALGLIGAILGLLAQLAIMMLLLGAVLLIAYVVALPADKDGL